MDSVTELKKKNSCTETIEKRGTRQSGVLDLPESYWPLICFVQRIAFANNSETKKLNIATANCLKINYEIKTCSIVFNDMFKNANIEKPNPRDCQSWNFKFYLINCKLIEPFFAFLYNPEVLLSVNISSKLSN